MYRLINDRTKRLMNILHLLVDHGKDVHIAEISKLNNCSERTVYYDLEKLTEEWNHLLKLDVSQAILVSRYESGGDLKQVVINLLYEDQTIKTLLLLFESANKSISYYAEKLRRSPSNIQQTFRKINGFLTIHGARIRDKKNKYFIEADDEYKIRSIFAELYWYIRRLPRNKRISEEVSEQIQKVLDNSCLKECGFVTNFLTALYTVCEIRKSQGFIVPEIDISIHLLENYLEFDDEMKKIVNKVTNCFINNDSSFSKQDISTIENICLFFLRRNLLYPHKVLPPADRTSGYREMYLLSNNQFYSVTRLAKLDLKIDIDVLRYLDECLFHIDLLFRNFDRYKRLKILVVSDESLRHAEVIKNFISFHFPCHETDTYCLDFYGYKDDTDMIKKLIQKEKYTVLVSTKTIHGVPTIAQAIIDDFPNDISILKLFQSIYYKTTKI